MYVRRLGGLVAVGLLLVIGFSFYLSRSAPAAPAEKIDLSQWEEEATTEAHSYQPDGDVIHFAVAAVLSPKETANLYEQLLRYVGQRLGKQVELVQGKTYAEINDLVKAGGVTLALVCTGAYLTGQEDFGMEALVVPQVRGEPYYYSYLIVSVDSQIQGLEQLRGETFAFTDPLSNSGRLAPLYQLWRRGETPESFFKKYIFTYSHDNSIKAVAEGLVEGAAVDSLVYDYAAATNPQYTSKTKIVERWGPFGINPIVVHPALDSRIKSQLANIFLTMHENPEGKDILEKLLIDKFVVPKDSIYDSVRQMRAAVRER